MRRVLSVFLCAVIVAMLFSACDQGAKGAGKIYPADYATVSFNGANGQGTSFITLDMAQFEEDLAKAYNLDADGSLVDMEFIMSAEMALDYKVEPDSGLSNGDNVKLICTVDENMMSSGEMKLKGFEKKITVEGLH